MKTFFRKEVLFLSISSHVLYVKVLFILALKSFFSFFESNETWGGVSFFTSVIFT